MKIVSFAGQGHGTGPSGHRFRPGVPHETYRKSDLTSTSVGCTERPKLGVYLDYLCLGLPGHQERETHSCGPSSSTFPKRCPGPSILHVEPWWDSKTAKFRVIYEGWFRRPDWGSVRERTETWVERPTEIWTREGRDPDIILLFPSHKGGLAPIPDTLLCAECQSWCPATPRPRGPTSQTVGEHEGVKENSSVVTRGKCTVRTDGTRESPLGPCRGRGCVRHRGRVWGLVNPDPGEWDVGEGSPSVESVPKVPVRVWSTEVSGPVEK